MPRFPKALDWIGCVGLLALVGSVPAYAQPACASFYRRLPPPLVLQRQEYTCGAACVVSLVKHLKGKEFTESHMAAVLGTNRSIGTTPDKMVAGLSRLGIKADVHERLRLRDLRKNFEQGKSQILLVQSDDTAHWVVLVGYRGGKVTLMDPWRENADYLSYSEQDFAALWRTVFLGRKADHVAIVTR
jgi:predicted double-glycine peptidase